MNIPAQDIDPYLSSLEHEYGVTIIGAWDTGSQAWGLASEHSDYDISFVFTQPLTHYATNYHYTESIDTNGESLQTVTDRTELSAADIEFMGWDARRFLELMNENNPSAMEALHSPLAYRTHPLIEDIKEYVTKRFNVIELFNHYQSVTKSQYNRYIFEDKERTVKKNLHVIRGAMHAQYIRETHEFPNLEFPQFVADEPGELTPHWDMECVRGLIEEKKAGNGDAQVGNPCKDAIEGVIDIDLNPRDHLRESDMNISSKDLDDYMQDLLQSRTLFQ